MTASSRLGRLALLALVVLAGVLAGSCATTSPGGPGSAAAALPSSAPTPQPVARPPSPCAEAARHRARIPGLLAEGKLHRTVRVIRHADALCPASAGDSRGALVLALAELGAYDEARKVAEEIDADSSSPAAARDNAAKARKIADERDRQFNEDAREAMKVVGRQGLAALELGLDDAGRMKDATAVDLARAKCHEAWGLYRPNGRALYCQAKAVRALGDAAEAQRLLDRAIVELEQELGAPVGVHALRKFDGPISAVAWSANRPRYAVASGADIAVFDAATHRELARLAGPRLLASDVTSLAIAPDGAALAAGARDGGLLLFDVVAGRARRALPRQAGSVAALAFSPSGDSVAAAAGDSVKLYDVTTGALRPSIASRSGQVLSLAFSPASDVLAFGTSDGTVHVSSVRSTQLLRTLACPGRPAHMVAFSTDGEVIACGSREELARAWSTRTWAELGNIQGRTCSVSAWAMTSDGRMLAAGCESGPIHVWDAVNGTQLSSLGQGSHAATSLVFAPESTILLSGLEDGTARLRDARKDHPALTLGGGTPGILALSFERENDALVSWNDDNTVSFWSSSTGALRRTVSGRTRVPARVSAVSPDGTRSAHVSGDATIAISNPPYFLQGHTGWVLSLAYSPNGRLLASGSQDKTARLWDAVGGNTIRTLEGHTGWVTAVAFSPDSRAVATGSADGSIRLWPVAQEKNSSIVLMRVPSSEDAVVFTEEPDARVEFFGDGGREFLVCQIGALSFPFELCAERFETHGLAARALAGDHSYLDP